jgi:cell division protein FtsZ
VNLTEGLGAGANPDVGQQSAIESIAERSKNVGSQYKMVLHCRNGWWYRTGAAPVIAIKREILTVGIVTLHSYLKVKFVKSKLK